MIKICTPWCGACSADHECYQFDPNYDTMLPRTKKMLARLLQLLPQRLDLQDATANGWAYLPLASGLYDA